MQETLLDFFQKGGVLMYPILVCSVVLVAVLVERFITLASWRVVPRKFLIEVEALLRMGKFADAMILCKTDASVVATILLPGIASSKKGWDHAKSQMEDVGKREVALLEKRTGMLDAIAGVAPLLGLLGTVFGMIEVFRQIEASGTSNIQFLSGGIYTALITTAFGLSVAIPSMLMARYFDNRVTSLAIVMAEFSQHILSFCHDSALDAPPNNTDKA